MHNTGQKALFRHFFFRILSVCLGVQDFPGNVLLIIDHVQTDNYTLPYDYLQVRIHRYNIMFGSVKVLLISNPILISVLLLTRLIIATVSTDTGFNFIFTGPQNRFVFATPRLCDTMVGQVISGYVRFEINTVTICACNSVAAYDNSHDDNATIVYGAMFVQPRMRRTESLQRDFRPFRLYTLSNIVF